MHLGTYGCHAKELLTYLKSINPQKLILNGDIIDIWNFSKSYFPKAHMNVLRRIMKMANQGVEVIYITGNHDDMLRKYTDLSFGNLHLVDKSGWAPIHLACLYGIDDIVELLLVNGVSPSVSIKDKNGQEPIHIACERGSVSIVELLLDNGVSINTKDKNGILRPDDLVVKSTGANSINKLYIIQNIDRKLNLDDIARGKGLNMDALIKEMEQIVYSGTKLNIKYWIDEILDDDQQEEIHDYFMESESDSIEDALKEFDGEYDINELRFMRIKFISEVAN